MPVDIGFWVLSRFFVVQTITINQFKTAKALI